MLKQLILRAFSLMNKKRLSTVAGAWVYYFLISVVPLAFLFVTAFSLFGVDVAKELVERLPLEFRSAGEAIADAAFNAREGVTVFFVVAVIFSCTTLLNQMSKDGDFIFESAYKTRRGLFRRVWALVALAVLFSMFLALALINVLWNTLGLRVVVNGRAGILLTIGAFLFIMTFGYLIIIALNKFVCPYKIKISQTLIGGLVSLFIMVLGTIAFIVYVRFFAGYNAFYGSLAGIVVFFVWTYILMLGLALGIIINSEIIKKHFSLPYFTRIKGYKY